MNYLNVLMYHIADWIGSIIVKSTGAGLNEYNIIQHFIDQTEHEYHQQNQFIGGMLRNHLPVILNRQEGVTNNFKADILKLKFTFFNWKK